MKKIDIKSMTFSELIKDFISISEKTYRAHQVYEWIVKGARSFEEMSNLPKKLREKLDTIYFIPALKIKDKKISKDGTIKYLFELYDENYI